MREDLKFALTFFRKERAFTLAALLTLALCIGANTAIFTVLNAVILEPLPYPDPSRLVALYNIYPGMGIVDHGANSVPDYLDRVRLTDTFDSVALVGYTGYDVGADGSPLRINGEYVTPSYFAVLRAAPLLGRVFTPAEAIPGNDRSVILSYGLWRQMFAGDPHAIGREMRLSGLAYRIAGVMPRDFSSPDRNSRLWVPFAFTPHQASDESRHNNSWAMLARLRPGVSAASAQQRIDALNRALIERFPKFRKLLEDARFRTRVVPLNDEIASSARPTLYLLQAAVDVVLLIGCVNVASLMLVRLNIRMREFAIRFSMGADRLRLARQLLTESLLLALLGGGLGLGTAAGCLRLISWLGVRELPRAASLHLSSRVLAFTLLASVLTGLAFGILPVFHLLRRDLTSCFRQSERSGTTERRAMHTRSVLVVAQVSLAFVLLIGAALLTLSFTHLLDVDAGFQPARLLTAQFSLPKGRYRDDVQIRGFIARFLEQARGLAGAANVGIASHLPFGDANDGRVVTMDGYTAGPAETPPAPSWNVVDAGYFQAMGIPLLSGRTFAESDAADSGTVVVIDQYLARRYWPGGDAIGRRIWRGPNAGYPACTVVGVVASVKTRDLAEAASAGQVYFHYKQFPPRTMFVVARSGRDSPQLASALARELLRSDPELPLFDILTMTQRVSVSMLNRRMAMAVWLAFAVLALLLSAIGIYGVLAYTVTQRTREFGIRVALGAGAHDVLGIVIGQGLRLIGLGLLSGIAGAFLLTRFLRGMLYHVQPADPRVFLGIAALLALVALIASLVPSLRAIRVRPAVAIRHE